MRLIWSRRIYWVLCDEIEKRPKSLLAVEHPGIFWWVGAGTTSLKILKISLPPFINVKRSHNFFQNNAKIIMSVSLSLLRKQFSVLKFYAEANCGWYLCFMLYIHKRNWHETYELAPFCASAKFPNFYCNAHTNIRWPVSGHYLFGVEITIFCYYSNPMVLSIEKLELCVDSKKIPNKIIIRWKFGRNFNTCKNLFFWFLQVFTNQKQFFGDT